MSISADVSNSEGMSNSDTKIRNVEVQIIPLCIRYQTVGNSDWKPTLDNLCSMKWVDSQHTPLVNVDFSPVDS